MAKKGMAVTSMLTFQFYNITLCMADSSVVDITATALSLKRYKQFKK